MEKLRGKQRQSPTISPTAVSVVIGLSKVTGFIAGMVHIVMLPMPKITQCPLDSLKLYSISPYESVIIPFSSAVVTAAVRSSTPSLLYMWIKWVLTVAVLMRSSLPISLLL